MVYYIQGDNMKKLGYIIFIIISIMIIVFINNNDYKYNDNTSSDIKLVYKEIDGISYPYFDDYEIDSKIENNIKDNKKYEINIIDNKYVSILFKNNNEYSTIFYDYINKEEKQLFDIFKNDSVKNIIYNELCNKYPKFIGDFIKDNDYKNLNYIIRDNEIEIHFDTNDIEPSLDSDIYIKLNNVLTKELLNISFKLDEDYINENIYEIDTNKKTVALTFDDGPTSLTENLIEILKNNHANATFFVQGSKIKYHPDAVNKSISYGNEYGSHTFNHVNLTKSDDDAIEYQISATNNALYEYTKKEIALVRPPYGAYNKNVLEKINYPLILWSIDSKDWSYKNVDKNYEEIMKHLKDKSIILMHETYNSSVETVEKLLPELYARGYQVVTVSKLMELNNIKLEAHKSYRSAK